MQFLKIEECIQQGNFDEHVRPSQHDLWECETVLYNGIIFLNIHAFFHVPVAAYIHGYTWKFSKSVYLPYITSWTEFHMLTKPWKVVLPSSTIILFQDLVHKSAFFILVFWFDWNFQASFFCYFYNLKNDEYKPFLRSLVLI